MIYSRYFEMTCDKLKNALNVYSTLAFRKVGVLEDTHCLHTKEHLRQPPAEGLQPLEGGTPWGGEYGNLWVLGTARFPEAISGKLYLMPDTEAVETLCFVDGKPNGLINSRGENIVTGLHSTSFLAQDVPAGAVFRVALECYAWHYTSGLMPYDEYGCPGPKAGEFDKVYHGVDIALRDEEVYGFLFDLDNALQLARTAPAGTAAHTQAAQILQQVLERIVQYPADVEEAVWRAALLDCRAILAPLYAHTPTEALGVVGIVGHSHMDTAWRWPISETIRKCARTYANVLTLMEQDPEYKFIQSSALHTEWMRLYYPHIFEGIAKYTAEGRYDPNGGVWVECDCNLTSGELMARQFLYGQRYTRKYLNYTADCFWLPDTFGYSAAIPQIMRLSGVKYFYTTKLSWGDLNEFPRDLFRWRGMDGTKVLTHLNIMHCRPDVEDLASAMKTVKDPDMFCGKLVAFGFGDGGGGPTAGMLEDARRVRHMPGVPKAEYMTASEFMHKVEQEAKDLAVYDGELYVEYHRGTLTMMHDIKRNNRRCEFALHNMDLANVLTGLENKEKTDELYKCLLMNQFHDILPGTSIEAVNVLARQEVTQTIREAEEITAAALQTLAQPEENALTVFNPAPYPTNHFRLEGSHAFADAQSQTYTDVTGVPATLVATQSIPAYESLVLHEAAPIAAPSPFQLRENTLETPFYTVTFREDGAISSLFDKENRREVASSQGLNVFTIGEDVPLHWDNWNVDFDQEKKMRPDMRLQHRSVISDGPLAMVIRSTYSLGDHSQIFQDMIFYTASRRIDFHTVLDWHDKHRLVKVNFDLDVFAPTMRNEIQFGYMERPLTRNNGWEATMFEVANHKWTDVSENRYGVAVLNDCKYGISGVRTESGSTALGLTLMKSGTKPDNSGDPGRHALCYSLLPHEGSFRADTVAAESYLLNIAPLAIPGSAAIAAPARVDAPNVVLETVKPAEDRKDGFVLRLYETERAKTHCLLHLPEAKQVFVTNILEDVQEELPVENGTVRLTFHPFEIKTLLVIR